MENDQYNKILAKTEPIINEINKIFIEKRFRNSEVLLTLLLFVYEIIEQKIVFEKQDGLNDFVEHLKNLIIFLIEDLSNDEEEKKDVK